jgi:hypothetical protein
MKHFLAFSLLALTSLTAIADDQYLVVPIASYHADRSYSDCEKNPGLMYQGFLNNNVYVGVGAFSNSYCKIAATVLVGWESHDRKRLAGIPYGYGVMAGITTGYPTPVVGAPYIRIGDRDGRVSARLMTIPHPTRGVYGLAFNVRLGD